jgi:hypothetical protein
MKIWIICTPGQPQGWMLAESLAEDGRGGPQHICSSLRFVPHDMGLTSDWKHDTYDKMYPEGWELVDVTGKPWAELLQIPEFAAAVEKNQARAEARKEISS